MVGGESGLLKMIVPGALILPPRVLCLVQKVVVDSTSVVDAVIKSNKKFWNLVEEKKRLIKASDARDGTLKKPVR